MKPVDLSRALLALLLLATPGGLAPPLLAEGPSPTPQKGLAAALQPFVDSHSLAGAVLLVADRDKVLSLESVGFADVAGHKPMRPDTLFWIASQSKPITAAALMMLVDEGKVRLDDPVTKYLPEFGAQWQVLFQDGEHLLLRRPKRPVTVRHLLSHTSGLPFSSALEKGALDRFPLRDAVQSYATTPLQSEPGSRFQYSNAGINTAGRIIEVVSGMPYEAFLDRRLFGPLGMKDTTFWPSVQQLARLAQSYQPNEARNGLQKIKITQLTYPLDDRKRQPMPAGGLFSTAPDLGRFCRMMLAGGVFEGKRYLSEAAVREMTRKQTGTAIKASYGLGWSTGKESFGHGGAYATDMRIDRKRGLITIFLVQHAGFPGQGGQSREVFQKAAEERFGKGRE
jgi:CubicO group peptidase (beta-lactamase class C family)